jgi:hypothetical protein
MEKHDCIHETDWGRIGEQIKNLTTNVSDLRIAISGLTKFMDENTGIRNYKEKQSLSARQRASVYISAILGLSSIVITLIIEFHK